MELLLRAPSSPPPLPGPAGPFPALPGPLVGSLPRGWGRREEGPMGRSRLPPLYATALPGYAPRRTVSLVLGIPRGGPPSPQHDPGGG